MSADWNSIFGQMQKKTLLAARDDDGPECHRAGKTGQVRAGENRPF